ncbi:MAG: hypothetical protein ACD_26C00094G0003 [uncultured bacterium]|nr:MAG: hypothetical protein ACD_26C00094G0003 [uncultured bacterium]
MKDGINMKKTNTFLHEVVLNAIVLFVCIIPFIFLDNNTLNIHILEIIILLGFTFLISVSIYKIRFISCIDDTRICFPQNLVIKNTTILKEYITISISLMLFVYAIATTYTNIAFSLLVLAANFNSSLKILYKNGNEIYMRSDLFFVDKKVNELIVEKNNLLIKFERGKEMQQPLKSIDRESVLAFFKESTNNDDY